MLNVQFYSGESLPIPLALKLGRYRKQVFVQQLGWHLSHAQSEFEWDQYDRNDTKYVVIQNIYGDICSCARLLPTVGGSYLLREQFPQLWTGKAPQSPSIWEISRLAGSESLLHSRGTSESNILRTILREAVRLAMRFGVRQLVGVTYLGIERLLRRMGVHIVCAGNVVQIDSRKVVAIQIEIDEQTLTALGLVDSQRGRNPVLASNSNSRFGIETVNCLPTKGHMSCRYGLPPAQWTFLAYAMWRAL